MCRADSTSVCSNLHVLTALQQRQRETNLQLTSRRQSCPTGKLTPKLNSTRRSKQTVHHSAPKTYMIHIIRTRRSARRCRQAQLQQRAQSFRVVCQISRALSDTHSLLDPTRTDSLTDFKQKQQRGGREVNARGEANAMRPAEASRSISRPHFTSRRCTSAYTFPAVFNSLELVHATRLCEPQHRAETTSQSTISC